MAYVPLDASGGYKAPMTKEESERKSQWTQNVSHQNYGIGDITYDFDADARADRLRMGRSWSNFDDLISYYDISRMPDIDGATMPLVGHLYFSRPSLNVCTTGNTLGRIYPESAISNYNNLCRNSITAAWAQDYYGKRLLHMLSDFNTSKFMPIFTTRAMSYAVSDMNIKTIEKGHTFFGHYVKYGSTTQEYRTAGSVTIEFRNDVYQSILKAIALWISYISIIAFSDNLKAWRPYSRNGILDYCGSIYYFVTKMDMSTLVYWEKLTGVFPRILPLSTFSYSDNIILEDKLNIEFEYAIRSDPCDPNVLFDINTLTGGSPDAATRLSQYGATGRENGVNFNTGRNKLVLPRDFEGPIGLGNAYASAPYIQCFINNDGTITYMLQHLRA